MESSIVPIIREIGSPTDYDHILFLRKRIHMPNTPNETTLPLGTRFIWKGKMGQVMTPVVVAFSPQNHADHNNGRDGELIIDGNPSDLKVKVYAEPKYDLASAPAELAGLYFDLDEQTQTLFAEIPEDYLDAQYEQLSQAQGQDLVTAIGDITYNYLLSTLHPEDVESVEYLAHVYANDQIDILLSKFIPNAINDLEILNRAKAAIAKSHGIDIEEYRDKLVQEQIYDLTEMAINRAG